jgi:undecaprenyl diphosphate synthase
MAPQPKAKALSPGVDAARVPRHLAVIMDGNGRWAERRGLPRVAGHRAGMASITELVRACDELHIPVLTLYAFSTENWKRPRPEVRFLMQLLIEFLRREINELHAQNVRLGMLGQRAGVPAPVLKAIDGGLAKTAGNTGLRLNFAFNYGGRREILDAVAAWGRQRRKPALTEAAFARFLYTAGEPDPDLLIRTSGEMRLSNFLLWQLAYAEMVVTPVLWPDFRKKHLLAALAEYQGRERRFGGVEAVHA